MARDSRSASSDSDRSRGRSYSSDAAPARPAPAGGVYVPPFKLAAMLAAAEQEGGDRFQRLSWDALRKSINGLINKVNAANIKPIFARILWRKPARPFTPVYAALVAVINTKFPEIGELLLHRVVTQFRRAYKRNDKPVCTAAATLLAHLVNQQVAHELIALEVLMLLLESPSDDGVELAAAFVTEVGALLQDLAPAGLASVFDRLRAVLHEGGIERRTQFVIENLFALRKAGFERQGHPAVPPELDLVEAEDQITHEISLDDKTDTQTHLDVFREDPDFERHEREYDAIKKEILGEEESEGDEEEDGDDSDSNSESGSSDDEDDPSAAHQHHSLADANTGGPIQDLTQTDLINLRRTIYLTIMSALDFEEAGHKLLKMGIPPGQEMELCTMIIECCSQEKTFIKYYALLGERFAKLRREYCDCFCECFARQYALIHRLETNKLRNVAKFFAHLAATDAVPWSVLACVRLTEEDTTSSSRIFVKIFFQELVEHLGLLALNRRLHAPEAADWVAGVFPTDSAKNMRFAINFFTSIGLGGLTDKMRETLKNLPALLAAQRAAQAALEKDKKGGDDSSSSDDDSSSSDDSSSRAGGFLGRLYGAAIAGTRGAPADADE
ncbi:hypothetical protein QBZ16_004095 [Prototheca wickerhamii]|uniref:MI domain-containing protein n=1 Tax=Prototheca wickerhamii TaxID=3111 RepID=A0AAD9MN83_PROWI|nr:hypothetical protein QBZ16_004095 [Prototheca wickerhamii]